MPSRWRCTCTRWIYDLSKAKTDRACHPGLLRKARGNGRRAHGRVDPGCGKVGAVRAIVEAVKKLEVRHRDQVLSGVTASLGLACFPHHGTNAAVVLQTANAAVHRSNEKGHNRLVVAEVR